MELRQYLAVLWRRWPVIALIVVLSAVASAVLFLRTPPTFTTTVSLLIRQEPTPDNPIFFTYDRYYNWFGTEFLSDDYTLIVASEAFADRVAAQLRANPHAYGEIDTGGVQIQQVYGTISAERKHRILTLTVRAGDYGLTGAIAQAATEVLSRQSLSDGPAPAFNGVEIQDKVQFGLLNKSDYSLVKPSSNRTRSALNAVVGVALGLVAALALAFLIEYFDTRLRDESEAERLLGLPILGAIPRK